jgi:hypothetical protein
MLRQKAIEVYEEILRKCSIGIISMSIVASDACSNDFNLQLLSHMGDEEKKKIQAIAEAHKLSLEEINDYLVIH